VVRRAGAPPRFQVRAQRRRNHASTEPQLRAELVASAAAAAIAGELVTTAPRRVEVAGEVQLGIEVAGADQRHRLHRSPSSAWATSSTSAAVERQDREHGARE
jgi:hypothetical protein